MAKKNRSGTPATTVLERAGIDFTLHPYDHDPANRHFGDKAAAALGVPAIQLFKTLITDCGGTLAVAVVPVSASLDLKAFATALGVKKVALADERLAERSSGMVVGGISPIGQRQQLPTVVDSSAEDFETIFVSAGRRGLQVKLAPADLIAVTTATVAAIART